MSTVCPQLKECSQSQPQCSLMSLKARLIHLWADSLQDSVWQTPLCLTFHQHEQSEPTTSAVCANNQYVNEFKMLFIPGCWLHFQVTFDNDFLKLWLLLPLYSAHPIVNKYLFSNLFLVQLLSDFILMLKNIALTRTRHANMQLSWIVMYGPKECVDTIQTIPHCPQ